jgi:hypothetical protein
MLEINCKRRVIVNTVANLRVSLRATNIMSRWIVSVSQEELWYMELVSQLVKLVTNTQC